MGSALSKHFVEFFSPGTVVSETTLLPIDAWDVEKAVEMSRSIVERRGVRPYGFRFVTRSRDPDDLDSKQTAASNLYYLGGKVETKAEVFARNDPAERILRSNMEINEFDRIIVNTNSYKFTAPLNDGDVVLEYEAVS